MTKHLNWYKRSPRDWQSGTIGMSLELRGFYSAFLDAMWERQGQLPKDDKWLAMACQCSTRMVRSLITKLIEQGKVIETEAGYYNRRMMADILGLDDVKMQGQFAPVSRPVRAPVEADSRSTRARLDPEPSAKNQKNPENTTRELEADTEAETDNTPPTPSRGPTAVEVFEAFEMWNATALVCGLAQAKLTPERRKKIAARMREHDGLESWRTAMSAIERSSFLTGGQPGRNGGDPFRASLDFVCQKSSFVKLIEGTYGNGRHGDAQPRQGSALAILDAMEF